MGPELITRPGGTASRILWALEDELTRRGIEIPFPQRDLRLRTVPEGFMAAGVERAH